MAIAARIGECLRPTDTIARLGGDEFAILLDGLEDWTIATAVAERVQNEFLKPFSLNGHEVYTTASIGIRLSVDGREDAETSLRDADTAMYRAKDNGKARHELFHGTMHTRAVALLKLENDLRRASEKSSAFTINRSLETHEQLELLRSLKCEYGQGYLFSRP